MGHWPSYPNPTPTYSPSLMCVCLQIVLHVHCVNLSLASTFGDLENMSLWPYTCYSIRHTLPVGERWHTIMLVCIGCSCKGWMLVSILGYVKGTDKDHTQYYCIWRYSYKSFVRNHIRWIDGWMHRCIDYSMVSLQRSRKMIVFII